MTVAVITAYHSESLDMLRQCHESVKRQSATTRHIMVADGRPRPELDDWDIQHVILPKCNANNGDLPRSVGGLVAAQYPDVGHVTYLDADNWYLDRHLSSMLQLMRHGKLDLVTCFRRFYTLDDRPMRIFEGQEDRGEHFDTSCVLLARSAFGLLTAWARIPPLLAPVGDRVFLHCALKAGHRMMSTGMRTVAFRSRYLSHYKAANMEVPPGHGLKDTSEFMAACRYLDSAEGQRVFREHFGFGLSSRALRDGRMRIPVRRRAASGTRARQGGAA